MKNIEYRDEYVFVEYNESIDTSVLISLMKEIAQVCEARNCKKILADLRNAAGTPNLFQRFQLGVMGAGLLRGISQIAVVYRADENNHFAESVAVNRGLPARITDDMEEAKRWLGIE
jgi:hypothetical protein